MGGLNEVMLIVMPFLGVVGLVYFARNCGIQHLISIVVILKHVCIGNKKLFQSAKHAKDANKNLQNFGLNYGDAILNSA
jgi:hypothetical protein